MPTIQGLALVQHAHRVRMIELRHRADFVFKSRRHLGITREPARDDFDRDDLLIAQPLRAIHLAHPPSADEFLHLIAINDERDGFFLR